MKQSIIEKPLQLWVERKAVSDFNWLKTPPAPSIIHCQVRGISFERFPRPWQMKQSSTAFKKFSISLIFMDNPDFPKKKNTCQYVKHQKELVFQENFPISLMDSDVPLLASLKE